MPTRPQLATIFRQHNSALMQISPPLTRALPIAMATSNQQIFFDAEQYPALTFSSTGVTQINDDTLEIAGTMQIKGQSKPVVLKAEYAGIAVDPYGQTKAGMTISGSIKRSDFGLTWSAVTEAGHVVVGDEIKLAAELQLIKQ